MSRDAAIDLGVLLAALVTVCVLALQGCAATFTCASDVRVELHDRSVIVKCLDGSAPTVTINASRVVGP